jgi:hypothetical protein
MSTLKSQLAATAAKKPAGPKVNPEIDAKINEFIAKNQGLYDHYMAQDKTVLARKLMLNRMRRSESMDTKVNALHEVVDSNPELKARVDSAMAKIPAEKREQAYRSVAQAAIADQAVAAQRTGPKLGI